MNEAHDLMQDNRYKNSRSNGGNDYDGKGTSKCVDNAVVQKSAPKRPFEVIQHTQQPERDTSIPSNLVDVVSTASAAVRTTPAIQNGFSIYDYILDEEDEQASILKAIAATNQVSPHYPLYETIKTPTAATEADASAAEEDEYIFHEFSAVIALIWPEAMGLGNVDQDDPCFYKLMVMSFMEYLEAISITELIDFEYFVPDDCQHIGTWEQTWLDLPCWGPEDQGANRRRSIFRIICHFIHEMGSLEFQDAVTQCMEFNLDPIEIVVALSDRLEVFRNGQAQPDFEDVKMPAKPSSATDFYNDKSKFDALSCTDNEKKKDDDCKQQSAVHEATKSAPAHLPHISQVPVTRAAASATCFDGNEDNDEGAADHRLTKKPRAYTSPSSVALLAKDKGCV